MFIALEKIKSCGIILVLKYDGYGGWNFIKQISDKKTDIGFHEIGIYYTQNKSKDSINHIEGNWFFRNTKYNIHKEKKIYRHVYNLIFNNM